MKTKVWTIYPVSFIPWRLFSHLESRVAPEIGKHGDDFVHVDYWEQQGCEVQKYSRYLWGCQEPDQSENWKHLDHQTSQEWQAQAHDGRVHKYCRHNCF